MRVPRRALAASVIAMWTVAVLIPAWLLMHPSALGPIEGSPQIVVMMSPLVRLPEFMLGMLAARTFLERRGRPHSSALHSVVLVGALGIALTAMAWYPHLPWYAVHGGGLALCFAAIVYVCAAGRTPLVRPLSGPRIVALGAASYSLYIIHLPLVQLAEGAARTLGMDIHRNVWAALLVLIPGAILAALASHRYVEGPGRRLILRLATGGRGSRARPEIVHVSEPESGTPPGAS